ncbi:MAG: hypothetical protein ACI9QL_004233 [Candidatus Omnitrophota bacterium]|jgi:hypothetical protein
MTRYPLDRRTFLRGAGAMLPLPFLNLMESSARAAKPATPPLRFMTLFKPNGVHPPSWQISGGAEHDFRMSPLMQPFAKHKEDLLILDNMGDFGFSSHSNSTRRFLCGHHQNTKSASIDQLIADQIGPSTPHRSLELTTEGLFLNQIGCSYISYDKKGQPIPRNSDAQVLFDKLFRNPMTHPTRRQAMSSLLDRVSDDARALRRKAGAEDKDTLDEYLTVVRQTEQRLENMKKAPPTRINFDELERPAGGGNLNDQVESMLDLIALALWTDSTRCATYMLGNSNSRMIFDFLGITKQHHYLSHFFRNNNRANLDDLLKISLWHMEKFDYLLTKMKSYKDHHGTLLEHSIVMFGSGMGHSDNHTATRIPLILAGQGNGRLKTGRYLRYAENQEISKLHLSLLQQFGVETNTYGGMDTPLQGLDGGGFKPYQERPFDSWVKEEGTRITVCGRLRLSDNLDEAKIFFLDIEGREPVRIEVGFGDFHKFNLAYHCGTAITLTGNGLSEHGQLVIKKVTDLQSVFGKAPGKQDG